MILIRRKKKRQNEGGKSITLKLSEKSIPLENSSSKQIIAS